MTFALCIAQEYIIFKKPFVTNKFLPFFLATHLVNQKYDVCMRKESGKKLNCYFPLSPASGAVGTAVINMGTFGLSVPPQQQRHRLQQTQNALLITYKFQGLRKVL